MDISSIEHRRGLDHALDTANRGWPVVPYLDRDDKKQLSSWPDIATTETEQILEWFDVGKPYEDAYVGVVPGKVGKACIDIDVHEGKVNGFETLKELRIPASAEHSGVSRSGKGLHLWFDGTGTSRPIYPGVDRKSIRGLVRVPYLLPHVEDVYQTLPKEFQIHNSESRKTEYEGSLVSWFEMYEGKPISPKVQEILDKTPNPFRGHDVLLRTQTSLIKMAVEGHGGVPEVLRELMRFWLDAEHAKGDSPQLEWSRALAGAITAFGGEPPKVDVADLHPDHFFEKSRLLVEKLAIALKDDLAIGHDGQTWAYSDGVWSSSPREIQRRVFRALRDRFDNRHAANVLSALTVGIGLPHLPEQPDARYINLKNSMYDWEKASTRPHSPELLSTIQLNFEFDQDAECPIFDSWLNEVLPEELHEMFWEFFGYMFLTGNPKQRAILLYGEAGTGKSTLLRLLTAMLGKHNISNVTLRGLSEGTFDRAQLFGKIANIAGDIDSRYMEDSSTFKQITGEDTIQAQHKFQQLFSFQAYAVPLFSANKLWRSSDTTDGYFRRWVIIPFNHKVDRAKHFDETWLWNESPGIFNKAMVGLRRLMSQGDFTMTDEAKRIFEEFQTESDVVRMWLNSDDSISTGDEKARTRKTSVYNQYKMWCFENGFKPLSSGELSKSLRAIGYETVKYNGIDSYKAISVNVIPTTVADFANY